MGMCTISESGMHGSSSGQPHKPLGPYTRISDVHYDGKGHVQKWVAA